MGKYLLVFIGLIAIASSALAANTAPADLPSKRLCTDAWYQTIEKQMPTSDAGKQGPEVGSEEWKSAVELKLNVRGKAGVPQRNSESWCHYVDELVHGNTPAVNATTVQGPSFSCDKAPGAIENAICNDKELSALDRKLAGVYADAEKKAAKKPASTLASEQREWTISRNQCDKGADSTACIRDAYFRRIAELEAVYQLIPGIGPVYYRCEGNSPNEIVIMFYETDPRTLVAQRGANTSLMYVVPSGSGTRYQGRNETFWEHEDEASIVWGSGTPQMRCKKAS